MAIAGKNKNILDWITQQWVIWFGAKIDPQQHAWLLGPFGSIEGIGTQFIDQLARAENLSVDEIGPNKGLIESISQLELSHTELQKLSPEVIDFYENTSNYSLGLKVKWNPFFKVFGHLVRRIFSRRIQQLNVPIQNLKNAADLTSEIIQLRDPVSAAVKRTIWLRTFQSTGQVVYSGVYETCTIPSGQSCIKAVFPLPNGSATVILTPSVGPQGELILDSAGHEIGDPGFYFLLKDGRGDLWSKFIASFQDKLIVRSDEKGISATQSLTLWNLPVLQFEYLIEHL